MPPKAVRQPKHANSEFVGRSGATVDTYEDLNDNLHVPSFTNHHSEGGINNYNNMINTSVNSIGKNQRAS